MSTPRYLSPLRYPGGKARMAPYLADTFAMQAGLLDVEIWLEPFAGGLGAGLALLAREAVCEVWFCETNPALHALWQMILTDLDGLADRVTRIRPTLDLFYAARDAVASAAHTHAPDPMDLAVAALILNRCSRSGMVTPNVGPIGGKSQTGRYTLTSRFDPTKLADRLRALSEYTPSMRLLDGSGIDSLRELDGSVGIEDELVAFVDPPYVDVGNRLYGVGMSPQDHTDLAWVLNTSPMRWMLTYDSTPTIADEWYRHRSVFEYTIRHTTHVQHDDTEYLIVSDNLALDPAQAPLSNGTIRPLHDAALEPEQFELAGVCTA